MTSEKLLEALRAEYAKTVRRSRNQWVQHLAPRAGSGVMGMSLQCMMVAEEKIYRRCGLPLDFRLGFARDAKIRDWVNGAGRTSFRSPREAIDVAFKAHLELRLPGDHPLYKRISLFFLQQGNKGSGQNKVMRLGGPPIPILRTRQSSMP
eukprot:g3636.t1